MFYETLINMKNKYKKGLYWSLFLIFFLYTKQDSPQGAGLTKKIINELKNWRNIYFPSRIHKLSYSHIQAAMDWIFYLLNHLVWLCHSRQGLLCLFPYTCPVRIWLFLRRTYRTIGQSSRMLVDEQVVKYHVLSTKL